MRASFVLAFLLAVSPLSAAPSNAQGSQQAREPFRSKVNENLLVLMSGPFGATYLQLANDISIVVRGVDDLRVLPVATGGSRTNIGDVLYARGVDMAIVSLQVLNAAKESGEWGASIERRITYIAPLAVDTFHVITTPQYKSLQDLKGKTASFNRKGSGTSVFGPKTLKTLGAPLDQVFVGPNDAIHLLQKGEIDAIVCSCPMPVPGILAYKSDLGLHFLEVPYVDALERDYVPASVTDADYPNLVAKGEKIHTIATNTLLITFNWTPGSERYKRVETFVNAFFSNVHKLRKAPRHPIWRNVNIAARIPGWRRFPAAQQWLDRQAATAAKAPRLDPKQARAQAAKAAPHDAAEQERLFKEFLEWSRRRRR